MKKFIVPIVSVVALVVGLLGLFLPTVSPQESAAGGVVNVVNGGSTFTNGADFGGPTPVTVNWAGDKIYAKSNQASWRNTTGQTQYIDYAEFSTDGVASSSYKVYIATSTVARIADDFSAPYAGLLTGFTIATSSVATTTNNYSTAGGRGVVRVPNGTYVNFQFQALNGTLCASSGGQCESATSTARGFNAFWRLRYHN